MKKLFLLFFLPFAWIAEVSAQIPPPGILTQPATPVSYCQNIQAAIPFTATGTSITYRWFSKPTLSCEFCETPLVNNTIYSGVTTNTLRINTGSLAAATYYYFCTVTNSGGQVSTTLVQFTVLASIAPNAPTTSNNSRCGSGSVTLGASGGLAGQYRWYTVATGGIPIAGQTAGTYTTPVLTGTTNYYVAINNGTCQSNRSIVTATINPIPPAPSATGASRCGSGSVTLSAAGGTAGQYRWYTVATGGTAIAGQTAATYATPALTGTTNYYVAINNGTCESNRTLVVATINPLPTAPTTTGANRCGTGSVTLSAAGGTAGQYRWYTVATGGTAITGQTAATYTTPVLTGTTNYYVAINNGTCESNRTIVTATINPIPTAPTTTGASNCGSGAVTLNASGGTAGQYRWYTVATGGTAIAGQTNAAYTTPTLTGTTNYYVAINNGTCESNRTIVTATINPIPTAPTTTGGSNCGSGTVTLNAAGGTAGQYRWYTVATGGTVIAGQTNAAYTTPTLTGTTNYYVAINDGTCESNRTIVTATINPIPTAPTTTGASNCGGGTVTLNAAGGTAGQYRWYNVATGGTAIAGETNAAYTTPTLTGTTNYYVAINNGTCESNRTIVTATINPIPTAPTTTGASNCGSGILTMNAAGGTAGQYRWYNVATGGTAIAGETNAAYTTPILTGTTNYYVAINNGTCESNRTIVTATINPIPTAPTTTGASNCGGGTVTLNAAGGTAGQYRWYTVATGGTAIAGETNAAYTTPTLTGTTNYYVAINNGTCESNRTIVTATINPIPTAPTTTGASNCGGGTVTLNAAGGTAGQYRWYNVATGGTAIAGETNAAYTTPTLTGTTNYYVAINNGTCESNRTLVTATINTLPTAPPTTGASNCGSGAVTLNAAGGTAGQYRWYTVATGGTAIAGETNAAYATPTLTGTTNYYVAINNGTCESNRTLVTATINPIPTAPTTTGASSCGSGILTLNASGGTAGQYRWYTVATGGTAIAGQTNAAYTTPTLTGTTNYYVAINNGTCESNRTNVTATINPIPTAPTTTGASNCGSGTVTLNAAGGTGGQYRWYTVATGGTAIAGQTNAAYTTLTLTGTTNYYVAINNGTCESNRTIVTATINPIPTAPTTTGASNCGSGILTLNASGGTAGQYQWYTVATGGTAIAGQTNAAYTTPTLTGTTNYYVAINNGACESNRTLVTATINPVPLAPVTTGNSSCVTASLLLTATGGSNGEYRWYTTPTGGVAISGESNGTFTTPVLSVSTNYYVALNNGSCEGPRSVVLAEINSTPTAPTTTGGSRCGSGSVTLNAAGAINGQYRWYTTNAGGTALAGQTSSNYTTPVLDVNTQYFVSISFGACESARTAVVASINPIPTAPTTTGASNCGSGAVTLNASGGTAGQYRWYTVATGGAAIAGQTNAAYTTPTLTGTTNYYVAINNGTCESNRTIVTATINPITTAPTTTGASNCGSGTVILNAAGGTAGQYRWYTVATGGTAIAGQTNAAYTTPTLTGTTNYYVAINNGTCESNRTIVTATINPIPTAPTTTGASNCGSGILTMNSSGGTAGQYRWYTVATGGTAIAGQTNAAYTTPTLTGTTNYYVAINNGTCESNRTIVTATINPIPLAPVTTGNSSCVTASLLLTATGGSNGEYRWYATPTGGVAITGETNGTFTTPILSVSTNYYVALNNGSCEGPRSVVLAEINSTPTAPTTTGGFRCGSGSVTLNAAGAINGQYRWYTTNTGGTALAGQTSSSYTTPVLDINTQYFVSISFGACESARTAVVATINPIPSTPVTGSDVVVCGNTSTLLIASGAQNGQYRWYDATQTLIPAQTNNELSVGVVTTNRTFYVSVFVGECESSLVAIQVVVDNNICNSAPSISPKTEITEPGGTVRIDVLALVSDPDDNIDPASIKIVSPPTSGAIASIEAGFLVIDYKGLIFAGIDKLIIEVCDLLGSCIQQEIIIRVEGNVNVYNGMSPNGDNKNEKWIIKNIESLPEAQNNKVSLFNRWGNLIFEMTRYNNQDRVFIGLSDKGEAVPSGVYFYKIEFLDSTIPALTGYITIKK